MDDLFSVPSGLWFLLILLLVCQQSGRLLRYLSQGRKGGLLLLKIAKKLTANSNFWRGVVLSALASYLFLIFTTTYQFSPSDSVFFQPGVWFQQAAAKSAAKEFERPGAL